MGKLDFLIRGAVPAGPTRSVTKGAAIHDVVSGEYCPGSERQVFRAALNVSPATLPGLAMPIENKPFAPQVWRWAGIDPVPAIPGEQILYIDTETTGLAGGTGTYAFMVGLGYFTGGKFRVEQYFLTDPVGEQALVAFLDEKLKLFRVLVSFNGGSYDLPLLQTRWILNGCETDLRAFPMVDLLPLARRLWRRTLPGCSLQQLEADVLQPGRKTDSDIPGREIPGLYFAYLRHGNAAALAPVFYHNRFDLVSMVLLVNRISAALTDPLTNVEKWRISHYGLARLLAELGETETAVRLYHQGLARHEELSACLRSLSFHYKRQGEWGKACNLWHQAAAQCELYALVELAKHAEHRERDYQTALGHTRKALDLFRAVPGNDPKLQAALVHRQHRLVHKLKRLEPDL